MAETHVIEIFSADTNRLPVLEQRIRAHVAGFS
jgi:hypothetical protein